MDHQSTTDKNKLVSSKHDLQVLLGDEWSRYLMLLKTWFRGQLFCLFLLLLFIFPQFLGGTKEDFDRQTRLFLTKQQIFYHNRFLLEILNKVGCIEKTVAIIPKVEEHESNTHSSRKRKKTTQHSFEQQTFHPYSPTEFVKEIPINTDPNKNRFQYRYAAQELFLSDFNLVSGRFLIGAWENGLSNVEDAAIEMIVQAVQIVLKNILSSCIRKRKHYRVTSEGNFYYDVGCPLKDPTLRNTISRQKVDDDTMGLNTRILTSAYMPKKTNDESLILAACEDRLVNSTFLGS